MKTVILTIVAILALVWVANGLNSEVLAGSVKELKAIGGFTFLFGAIIFGVANNNTTPVSRHKNFTEFPEE